MQVRDTDVPNPLDRALPTPGVGLKGGVYGMSTGQYLVP